MDKLEPPQHFLFEGNVSHTWKLWLKQLWFYLIVTKRDNKDDKVKTSMLLTCIGQKGREISETFPFDLADDEMKLEPVLNKFSEYNNPSKNVTILRHNFLRIDSLKARVFTILLQKRKK